MFGIENLSDKVFTLSNLCACAGFIHVTYIINEQLREAWAQVACMIMLVPGCEGIGN